MSSCIPSEEGYYFATWKPNRAREKPFRVIVRIGRDGFGHTRAFMTRASRGYNPSEFEDYSQRIEDPGPRGGRKSG